MSVSESVSALADAVRRYTDAQGGSGTFATAVDGLTLHRANHERRSTYRVFKPALCVVVQGAKTAVIGDRRLEYRAGQALVASVEVPGVGRVAEASPSEPYLGVIVEFELATTREVLEGLTSPPGPNDDVRDDGRGEPRDDARAGVVVVNVAAPLADCVLRLVRLLDTPAAIPTLRPLIMRELCYWLLTGPHGGVVARMALATTHAVPVLRAVHALRDRFAEPVRVEELARVARLSPSAFHRQFRAVTSLTPLQYQKQLRLLEARRLMVADALGAEAAAYQVGYESPSQFSREYARMFGAPPRRDVGAVRAVVAGESQTRDAEGR